MIKALLFLVFEAELCIEDRAYLIVGSKDEPELEKA
jgi:hypothetical protein